MRDVTLLQNLFTDRKINFSMYDYDPEYDTFEFYTSMYLESDGDNCIGYTGISTILYFDQEGKLIKIGHWL